MVRLVPLPVAAAPRKNLHRPRRLDDPHPDPDIDLRELTTGLAVDLNGPPPGGRSFQASLTSASFELKSFVISDVGRGVRSGSRFEAISASVICSR